jgi:transposase
MSAKQHFVRLNAEERQCVERAVRSNQNSPRERMRARILLAASDPAALSDQQIAAQVGASALTVWRVRRRFAERGLVGALHHAEQKRRKARRLDGRAEAHLVALTCSAPPEDRKRWSLHLLGRKLVAAEVVESVSHETVRQTLKKINSSRG